MVKNIHTDLEDAKLIERCRNLIDDFTKNKMREWTMNVPARPNEDPDLVFSELISRYEKSLDPEKIKGSDQEKIKGSDQEGDFLSHIYHPPEEYCKGCGWRPETQIEGDCWNCGEVNNGTNRI